MSPADAPLPHPAEYVLPLRWDSDEERDDLTAYLRRLSRLIDVTVIDGSDDELFAEHDRVWSGVRHMRPAWPGRNGKARGAITGIVAARHERVVVADDDVRYDGDALAEVLARLDGADLVRPQNVFVPSPWHARWDTGRSLLNRAGGGDFSGTVALRRTLLLPDGYDTDVLFENLQLERTVRARGGRVVVARDVFVARRPPILARFVEQRVRQAYDDFAQPGRLIRELAALPILVTLVSRRRAGMLVLWALAVVAVAEFGRRRDGGRNVYRSCAALWALAWALERAITVWIAVALRLRGGVRYRGSRIRQAASRPTQKKDGAP